MKKEVVVLDADEQQRQNLCSLLADHNYSTIPIATLSKMDRYLAETDCQAVVLNLDNIAITNKIVREFKRKKPFVNIIALSERQFHPELEEALREHISVCLAKPIETDELIYWLKTIFNNA